MLGRHGRHHVEEAGVKEGDEGEEDDEDLEAEEDEDDEKNAIMNLISRNKHQTQPTPGFPSRLSSHSTDERDISASAKTPRLSSTSTSHRASVLSTPNYEQISVREILSRMRSTSVVKPTPATPRGQHPHHHALGKEAINDVEAANAEGHADNMLETPKSGLLFREELLTPLFLPTKCEPDLPITSSVATTSTSTAGSNVLSQDTDSSLLSNIPAPLDENASFPESRKLVYCLDAELFAQFTVEQDRRDSSPSARSSSSSTTTNATAVAATPRRAVNSKANKPKPYWGLTFESNFECGNLFQAEYLSRKGVPIGSAEEYDLYLLTDPVAPMPGRPHDKDALQHKRMSIPCAQWFCFRIKNTKRRWYRFHIHHFTKPDSFYSNGMKPLLLSELNHRHRSIGWQRVGEHVVYKPCTRLPLTNFHASTYHSCLPSVDRLTDFFTLSFTVFVENPKDTVYLSFAPPYTYTQLQNMMFMLTKNPATQAHVQLRTLCRTIAGNRVSLLTITEQNHMVKSREQVESEMDSLAPGFVSASTNNSTTGPKPLRSTEGEDDESSEIQYQLRDVLPLTHQQQQEREKERERELLLLSRKNSRMLSRMPSVNNSVLNDDNGSIALNSNTADEMGNGNEEFLSDSSSAKVPRFLQKLQKQMNRDKEQERRQRIERYRKPAVIVIGRIHPNETPSSWIIEGMIKSLLADHPLMKALRSQLVFYFIPMINPDGVVNGLARNDITGYDLQDNWLHPQAILLPHVSTVKELIKNIHSKTPIAGFFDVRAHSSQEGMFFHSLEPERVSASADSLMTGVDKRFVCDPRSFFQAIAKRSKYVVPRSCSLHCTPQQLTSAKMFVGKNLKVSLSLTVEASMFGAPRGAALAAAAVGTHMLNAGWQPHLQALDYAKFGGQLCVALHDLFLPSSTTQGRETNGSFLGSRRSPSLRRSAVLPDMNHIIEEVLQSNRMAPVESAERSQLTGMSSPRSRRAGSLSFRVANDPAMKPIAIQIGGFDHNQQLKLPFMKSSVARVLEDSATTDASDSHKDTSSTVAVDKEQFEIDLLDTESRNINEAAWEKNAFNLSDDAYDHDSTRYIDLRELNAQFHPKTEEVITYLLLPDVVIALRRRNILELQKFLPKADLTPELALARATTTLTERNYRMAVATAGFHPIAIIGQPTAAGVSSMSGSHSHSNSNSTVTLAIPKSDKKTTLSTAESQEGSPSRAVQYSASNATVFAAKKVDLDEASITSTDSNHLKAEESMPAVPKKPKFSQRMSVRKHSVINASFGTPSAAIHRPSSASTTDVNTTALHDSNRGASKTSTPTSQSSELPNSDSHPSVLSVSSKEQESDTARKRTHVIERIPDMNDDDDDTVTRIASTKGQGTPMKSQQTLKEQFPITTILSAPTSTQPSPIAMSRMTTAAFNALPHGRDASTAAHHSSGADTVAATGTERGVTDHSVSVAAVVTTATPKESQQQPLGLTMDMILEQVNAKSHQAAFGLAAMPMSPSVTTGAQIAVERGSPIVGRSPLPAMNAIATNPVAMSPTPIRIPTARQDSGLKSQTMSPELSFTGDEVLADRGGIDAIDRVANSRPVTTSDGFTQTDAPDTPSKIVLTDSVDESPPQQRGASSIRPIASRDDELPSSIDQKLSFSHALSLDELLGFSLGNDTNREKHSPTLAIDDQDCIQERTGSANPDEKEWNTSSSKVELSEEEWQEKIEREILQTVERTIASARKHWPFTVNVSLTPQQESSLLAQSDPVEKNTKRSVGHNHSRVQVSFASLTGAMPPKPLVSTIEDGQDSLDRPQAIPSATEPSLPLSAATSNTPSLSYLLAYQTNDSAAVPVHPLVQGETVLGLLEKKYATSKPTTASAISATHNPLLGSNSGLFRSKRPSFINTSTSFDMADFVARSFATFRPNPSPHEEITDEDSPLAVGRHDLARGKFSFADQHENNHNELLKAEDEALVAQVSRAASPVVPPSHWMGAKTSLLEEMNDELITRANTAEGDAIVEPISSEITAAHCPHIANYHSQLLYRKDHKPVGDDDDVATEKSAIPIGDWAVMGKHEKDKLRQRQQARQEAKDKEQRLAFQKKIVSAQERFLLDMGLSYELVFGAKGIIATQVAAKTKAKHSLNPLSEESLSKASEPQHSVNLNGTYYTGFPSRQPIHDKLVLSSSLTASVNATAAGMPSTTQEPSTPRVIETNPRGHGKIIPSSYFNTTTSPAITTAETLTEYQRNLEAYYRHIITELHSRGLVDGGDAELASVADRVFALFHNDKRQAIAPRKLTSFDAKRAADVVTGSQGNEKGNGNGATKKDTVTQKRSLNQSIEQARSQTEEPPLNAEDRRARADQRLQHILSRNQAQRQWEQDTAQQDRDSAVDTSSSLPTWLPRNMRALLLSEEEEHRRQFYLARAETTRAWMATSSAVPSAAGTASTQQATVSNKRVVEASDGDGLIASGDINKHDAAMTTPPEHPEEQHSDDKMTVHELLVHTSHTQSPNQSSKLVEVSPSALIPFALSHDQVAAKNKQFQRAYLDSKENSMRSKLLEKVHSLKQKTKLSETDPFYGLLPTTKTQQNVLYSAGTTAFAVDRKCNGLSTMQINSRFDQAEDRARQQAIEIVRDDEHGTSQGVYKTLLSSSASTKKSDQTAQGKSSMALQLAVHSSEDAFDDSKSFLSPISTFESQTPKHKLNKKSQNFVFWNDQLQLPHDESQRMAPLPANSSSLLAVPSFSPARPLQPKPSKSRSINTVTIG